MAPALVIFDMDGVVFEGRNFWLDLHREYGTEADAMKLARHLSSDYARVAHHTARELWKGKSAEPYYGLVRSRKYQAGIADVLRFLKRTKTATAIVSSGPLPLASRAKRDLGFDHVVANDLLIEGDAVSGGLDLQVSDSDKARAGLAVMRRFDAKPRETAFVADGEADAALADLVGLSIAYATDSERLARVADYRLNYGDLPHLIRIFESWPCPPREQPGALGTAL